jgi:hypothetical protein
MAPLSHILQIPNLDYPSRLAVGHVNDQVPKQEFSEKAAADRRRCRDRLLPSMQNGQPNFLTKDESRVAAMRQLNVSKGHSISRGSMPMSAKHRDFLVLAIWPGSA